MIRSKKCFKCCKRKKITCFYRHSEMSDGVLNKCKDCAKKDTSSNRLKKINKYREYDFIRSKTKKRIKLSAKVTRRFREKFPGKYAAHMAVKNAINKGLLKKKPCLVCGNVKNIHAHHEDYRKKLDVIWLCAEHHKARHKEIDQ